ncbi:hypothetical protein SAMN05421747_101272 [Parapedobacter composti]|uniref:Uncharacterized protein n=1 Tax=Parapedobacter composti TaxID=623281 RepID=A0A1I1E221_9SPHI|nr:hypothetical protein SAMN05421747_101272 [Parapedobacter composti]
MLSLPVVRKHRHIRSALALFQAALFCLIIGSGTVFMHKHKTADGRIVIHTHPYNLKKNQNSNQHHQSQSQIHLLDVIFQGSYLQPALFQVDFSLILSFEIPFTIRQVPFLMVNCGHHLFLRGPPTQLS